MPRRHCHDRASSLSGSLLGPHLTSYLKSSSSLRLPCPIPSAPSLGFVISPTTDRASLPLPLLPSSSLFSAFIRLQPSPFHQHLNPPQLTNKTKHITKLSSHFLLIFLSVAHCHSTPSLHFSRRLCRHVFRAGRRDAASCADAA